MCALTLRTRGLGRPYGASLRRPYAAGDARSRGSRAGAGKVNVDGASQQKWDSSFISDEGGRPRIVARAPKGHVALRALSWIDAIRRKVGLPEGFEKARRSSSSS